MLDVTRRGFMIGSVSAGLVASLGIKAVDAENWITERVAQKILVPKEFPYTITSLVLKNYIVDVPSLHGYKMRKALPHLASCEVEGYGMDEWLVATTECWSIHSPGTKGKLVGEFMVTEQGYTVKRLWNVFRMVSVGPITYIPAPQEIWKDWKLNVTF